MKFFLSGEIDLTKQQDRIDNKFPLASSYAFYKLALFFEADNCGSEVAEVIIIPIIVKPIDEIEPAYQLQVSPKAGAISLKEEQWKKIIFLN